MHVSPALLTWLVAAMIVAIVAFVVLIIYFSVSGNNDEGQGRYFNKKHKKIPNDNELYTAYIDHERELMIVTFKSDENGFQLPNAIYWLYRSELWRYFNINRIMYLDLDTNYLYRPNYGRFDMLQYPNMVINHDKMDNIESIELTMGSQIMKFNYEKFL